MKKEKELANSLKTYVPYGYNVAICGQYHPSYPIRHGADNPNAKLTEDEAQYILNNRDKPMLLLYEDFNEKISYGAFKNIYHHNTYKNLPCNVEEYPYNSEWSNQFCKKGLEYDEVVDIRNRYANGEYWRDVYKDYKDIYSNEWSFWNAYNGNSYKLVMPEVFTEENKHKHASRSKVGSLNGRSKLTWEDVKTIRTLFAEGVERKIIYEKYPQVSPSTIRSILNNKSWVK